MQGNTDTDEKHTSRVAFTKGESVFDTDQGRDDGKAYVVGVTDQRADDYYIEAIDKPSLNVTLTTRATTASSRSCSVMSWTARQSA